jgi:hypothetical protein
MNDIEKTARELLAAEWERDSRGFTARAIRDSRPPSGEAEFERAIRAIVAALSQQPQGVPDQVCPVCGGSGAAPLAVPQGLPDASPMVGKYGHVLRPFVAMMERELQANAGKGDRPGWLGMDRKTALLEIFYHLAKLQKAAKDDDAARIVEHGADVANMAMMLVDVCGQLPVEPEPQS